MKKNRFPWTIALVGAGVMSIGLVAAACDDDDGGGDDPFDTNETPAGTDDGLGNGTDDGLGNGTDDGVGDGNGNGNGLDEEEDGMGYNNGGSITIEGAHGTAVFTMEGLHGPRAI